MEPPATRVQTFRRSDLNRTSRQTAFPAVSHTGPAKTSATRYNKLTDGHGRGPALSGSGRPQLQQAGACSPCHSLPESPLRGRNPAREQVAREIFRYLRPTIPNLFLVHA